MPALVAKSYQNYKQIGEPFVENGKSYIKVDIPCDRCGGRGASDHPSWVVNGSVCFKCHGAGKDIKTVRVYSEKEYERMENLKNLRAEKAEEERILKLEQKKKDLPKKLGFTQDENGNYFILIVLGDTYTIKDILKEQGAKYKPAFGWYFSGNVEIADHYECYKLFWDSILNTYCEMKSDEEIKKFIKQETTEPSFSKFQGVIGQKIEREVSVNKVIDLSGRYGISYMHIFEDKEKNIYVWITASKKLEQNKQMYLTGTVKDHKEYNEVKQTILTRCKIL